MNAINIEAMLLAWSESHNGGAKITLQLADADDLELFKLMTVAKGKQAGQRLACAFVEVGDDELPVTQPQGEHAKGGALARLAGMWCEDEGFQAWLGLEYENSWLAAMAVCPKDAPADWAAMVVRGLCNVTSRADLDHDQVAAANFHSVVREPYMAHLKAAA